MTSKHIGVVAAIAALAVPTAAIAKKPDTAGSQGKGHAKAKNAVFTGNVVSVDVAGGSVLLHVVKGNKWARGYKDTDVTFTVATVKKLGVADTNGDGQRTLDDVVAGARAQAQAKIVKDAPQPFAARKLKVYAPAGAETEGTEQE
jgi:ABC-type uncharacterized transport system ATPase subunit